MRLTAAATTDDAGDRRAALEYAVSMVESLPSRYNHGDVVLVIADVFYDWLRQRDSLQLQMTITAGPVMSQPGKSRH